MAVTAIHVPLYQTAVGRLFAAIWMTDLCRHGCHLLAEVSLVSAVSRVNYLPTQESDVSSLNHFVVQQMIDVA